MNKIKETKIKLKKELHKYINENTSSGAISPYLKKLEETVNKFIKEDNDKKEPKDNKRNMRSKHIDRIDTAISCMAMIHNLFRIGYE